MGDLTLGHVRDPSPLILHPVQHTPLRHISSPLDHRTRRILRTRAHRRRRGLFVARDGHIWGHWLGVREFHGSC